MGTFEEILDEICEMLSCYSGRDKVIRTLCYAAKLASVMNAEKHPDAANKLKIFSSKMSQTRATLRLFDDLPMLQCTLQYGWGKHEPDRTLSVIGVLSNIFDTIYYPIDKICWLAEYKLLHVENPTLWDTLSSLFWLMSNYLSLIKTWRFMQLTQNHKKCLSNGHSSSAEKEVKIAFSKVQAQKEFLQKISMIRNCIDIIHAGSTLPKGLLWGGKIPAWQVAFIGTLSSLLGMYQFLAKRRLAKS
ncbi:peroxisomal membrane protein 11C [Culicoides brevitarsis]|uniref:peroxisomal membrane protein 11C n=1 Tax=Culicoides brevitarsis TaxID=469753 RepID=UPI00307B8AE3